MQRRHFLLGSAALATGALWPIPRSGAAFDPSPANGWRRYEITTRVEVLAPEGATRVWLPLPSVEEAGWISASENVVRGGNARIELARDPVYGAQMLSAEWDAGVPPVLEVSSRVATRDRRIDFARRDPVAPLSEADRRLYTRATAMLPTDGIVRQTALDITRGAATDRAKAHAIYDWVVENTVRNPTTRGCGLGDIRTMLITGDLSGKCADLNALYVGLARAAGLPARDVYGIRVADSRFGYKSLGKSEDISKAQHCRSEVWLDRLGWVPVDPADVRKVMLEEPPGGLGLDDARVEAVRARLFGAWEMNWVAYNTAHDLALPGAPGVTVPFLMYPQGQTASGMLDSLDPDRFRYRIRSREVAAGPA